MCRRPQTSQQVGSGRWNIPEGTRTLGTKPFPPSAKQGWDGHKAHSPHSVLNFIFQDKPRVPSSVTWLLCGPLTWGHTSGASVC